MPDKPTPHEWALLPFAILPWGTLVQVDLSFKNFAFKCNLHTEEYTEQAHSQGPSLTHQHLINTQEDHPLPAPVFLGP